MVVSLFGLGLLLGPAQAQTVPPPPIVTEWRKPALSEPATLPPLTTLPSAPVPAAPPSRLDDIFQTPKALQAKPSSGWKGYPGTLPVQHAYPVPGKQYPGSPIQQVRQQQMPSGDGGETHPALDPPSPDKLFRLDSERNLRERMRQEALSRAEPSRIVFPEEPPVSKERYFGRRFPRMIEQVEPGYVVYKRLLFEQKNAERYGWSYGPLSPVISAAVFYKDVALLPYHLATRPFQQWETNAGYPLPGDPQPLLLYPEEFSLTGLAAEAAVGTSLFFIFP
jgi:hypothetical protein